MLVSMCVCMYACTPAMPTIAATVHATNVYIYICINVYMHACMHACIPAIATTAATVRPMCVNGVTSP